MNIINTSKPVSDEDRAASNFNGDLIVYQNIPSMHKLITFADGLLRKVLEGIEPIEAQHHFSPSEF